MSQILYPGIEKFPLYFGDLVGLIAGDGGIYKNRINFSNSNKECIGHYLFCLKKVFNIQPEDLSFYLRIRDDRKSKSSKKWWELNLNLQKCRILINTNKYVRVKNGIMAVDFSNKEIARLLSYSIENIGELGIDASKGFIRGFTAAEGYVKLGAKRKEIANSVQLPQKGKELLIEIQKMLINLGIKSRIVIKDSKQDYYCINITGQENFRKFFELGLTDIHPKKKERLGVCLEGYKKFVRQSYETPIEVLKIFEDGPKEREFLYKNLKWSKQYVNFLLYGKRSVLVKNRLIKKHVSKDKITWQITPKGKSFLKKY